MTGISLNHLGRQTELLRREIEQAVRTVLESGWFILGPQVEAFEADFARFCGSGHCVGVGNGTDALELALRALDIGPGDRVATVANAGGYSTAAILAIGAEPLYVEVDPISATMDPRALSAVSGPSLRAVIVTHLYGRMADMPALISAVDGVPIIEDCAQAHGARLKGRGAGTWGALGTFSFYPTKNLGALGDGGAILTSDPVLFQRVRALRQYGWSAKYHSSYPRGRNSRLDELQAAVLRAKLPHLDAWNRRRREIADTYNSLLDTGRGPLGQDDVAHLYVIRSPHRDALRRALSDISVGTDVHYPVPDYRQESIGSAPFARCVLPETEACCATVLTLPCYPELRDSEVAQVAHAALRSGAILKAQ